MIRAISTTARAAKAIPVPSKDYFPKMKQDPLVTEQPQSKGTNKPAPQSPYLPFYQRNS